MFKIDKLNLHMFLRGFFSLFGFILVIFILFILGTKNFSIPNVSSVKNFPQYLKALIFEKKSETTLLKQSVVEEESAIISVVEKVSPAVVSIVRKTIDFDPFSGPVSQESGIGTGFIVSSKGIIVTNSHVVSDPNADYSIVLKDGSTYEVKKVHRDNANDLAIIEVNAKNLKIAELGDSSKLKVGQKAIAIGNALGQFSNSVTVGVISGVSRQLEASGPFGEGAKLYTNVLQTDAALNPGNSGGPLLNLLGQVIGVNVAVTRSAQNIGFAIPIDVLKPILKSFEENGRIIRPYLGVTFQTVTADLARFRRFPEGAFITRVGADTPAEKAGLERGDIVMEISGSKINEKNPLDAEIQQKHKVGETVQLKVDRQGEILNLEAVLEEAKED